MKLWVSWYDIQQGHPAASREESWRFLRDSPNLHRLDAQVRAAVSDGMRTIVTIYQAFPTWATGASGPDPLSSKSAAERLPGDLSPDGPWAWFVGYLSEHYAGQVAALEVVNEPNTLYWPMDNIVEATATMMRTAASVSARFGRQPILAPATSDYPDAGEAQPGVTMDWRTFTERLLAELGDWKPPVPVHWSQHNYNDVRRGTAADSSRAKQALDLLGGDELWLTEGGYNLGRSWRDPEARALQAELIRANYQAMRTLPGVVLWTQHGINDVHGNDFKSGLRDDFDYDAPAPGPERPAWTTWLDL